MMLGAFLDGHDWKIAMELLEVQKKKCWGFGECNAWWLVDVFVESKMNGVCGRKSRISLFHKMTKQERRNLGDSCWSSVASSVRTR